MECALQDIIDKTLVKKCHVQENNKHLQREERLAIHMDTEQLALAKWRRQRLSIDLIDWCV